MNIVIDARMIGHEIHGIARYTYNLIKSLLKIDKKNKYTVLTTEKVQDVFLGISNLEAYPLRSRWISLSEQWELVKILKKLKPDLYHAPSFVAPVFNPFPMVMTIHDLNHLALAKNYSFFHALYYRLIVKPSAGKSVKIFTDSEFSRKEISKYLLIPDEKIKVISIGCGEEFKPIQNPEVLRKVREKYGLPETFILYVGTYKPHKNVSNLLKAFSRISLEIPLALSGKGNQELLRILKELKLDKKIIFMGEIDENDLPGVYNCANLFVFPSYYEGFGLPPIEAMACGCPAVVSNATSLPEVCGNAAYYVDPFDVEDMAKGIYQVLTDKTLRQILIQKGFERTKLYRWEKTAEEHLKVFEEIATG
jgi:glycosyltransferase involved in cell wall biosynthesis